MAYEKLLNEIYAAVSLKYLWKEYEPYFVKSESPDWINPNMDFGLEVSQALLPDDGQEEKPLYDAAYIRHSYELVIEYEKQGQQYRWLIAAGIVIMTAFVFLTVGWRIAGILLLVTGLLVAMQPRISYRIAERDVTAELYQALPRWLFEMVLL